MKKKTGEIKQEIVDIELCAEDAAKARILCRQRGWSFPQGLSFLVQEVVHPEWREVSPAVGSANAGGEPKEANKTTVLKVRATSRSISRRRSVR